ncbi:MAG: hypothetical protein ACYDH6_16065 [Acidimicrobiales bacterium]
MRVRVLMVGLMVALASALHVGPAGASATPDFSQTGTYAPSYGTQSGSAVSLQCDQVQYVCYGFESFDGVQLLLYANGDTPRVGPYDTFTAVPYTWTDLQAAFPGSPAPVAGAVWRLAPDGSGGFVYHDSTPSQVSYEGNASGTYASGPVDAVAAAFGAGSGSLVGYIAGGLAVILALLLVGLGVSLLVKYLRKAGVAT